MPTCSLPHPLLDDCHDPNRLFRVSLDYPVILKKSTEGYAVGCPALPGCWSQGKTEKEALANIRVAIQEYLAVLNESLKNEEVRSVTVTV